MTQQPPPTSTQQPPEEPRPLGDQLKLIGAGAFGLALIIFVLSNLQPVDINFLWFGWHTRMIWALIASSMLGSGGVFLTTLISRRQARRKRKQG